MSNPENSWGIHNHFYPQRIITAEILEHHFFHYKIISGEVALRQAREMSNYGMGIIIVTNHFSEGDIVLAGLIACADPIMGKRKILAPIAHHQYHGKEGLKARVLAAMVHGELCPIITSDTLRYYRQEGKSFPFSKNQLRSEIEKRYADYIEKAQQVLADGGIVPMAPQAGRRERLIEPWPNDSVGSLLNFPQNHQVAVFPVGIGIVGAESYKLDQYGGLNRELVYTFNFGRPRPFWEIQEEAARNHFSTDEVVYQMLRRVVPKEYLATTT